MKDKHRLKTDTPSNRETIRKQSAQLRKKQIEHNEEHVSGHASNESIELAEKLKAAFHEEPKEDKELQRKKQLDAEIRNFRKSFNQEVVSEVKEFGQGVATEVKQIRNDVVTDLKQRIANMKEDTKTRRKGKRNGQDAEPA
ncbi:MAG: hypothetical protein WED05_07110 [Candidatus Atabeyarchaeum deiterrae]